MSYVCLDCGTEIYDEIAVIMGEIQAKPWCFGCGSDRVTTAKKGGGNMTCYENIIVAARELAAKYEMTVDQALDVIRISILEQTREAAVMTMADDPRIGDLQKDVETAGADSRQAKEWISQIRQGVTAHEGKIETLMDAAQSLITTQSEQARALVEIRQRLGLDIVG